MPPSPAVNVTSYLAALAATDPDRVAVYLPRGRRVTPADAPRLTFRELNADADAVAHGLAAAGIGRGARTVLMVPPSFDFFALTFALFKVAAVPVLIDPGMGVRNLGRCLAEAGPEAFVGVPKAHLARRLLGWAKRTVRTTVNVGRGRLLCTHSVAGLRAAGTGKGPYDSPAVSADDPAAVLFTSGSTGVAKGAEYTHGIFAAQVELLKSTYGIEPGEIDLCTFPLFALFGPALGMTCVIPDMNPSRPAAIDPDKTVRAIQAFGVTNLFGSPAVVRRLGHQSVTLDTVRRAISAGAPASVEVIEQFQKLLPPGVEVFTPYGATEALPVANIGSREILDDTRHLTEQGKGVCVGRPVRGITVSVVPITDGPVPEWDDSLGLPPGQVGEFVVRGPVVTRRYFNRPEATTLAKIVDPKTGDVLHRMGDVGYADEAGRLWFCGRKSHRVETPWGALFTDMVEPVFNTVASVARTALVGVERAGVIYPVICVERMSPAHPPSGVKWRFARPPWVETERELHAAAMRFDHTRSIHTFLDFPGLFPVDTRHNSKIFREKLALWADRQLGKRWKPPTAHPSQRVGSEATPR